MDSVELATLVGCIVTLSSTIAWVVRYLLKRYSVKLDEVTQKLERVSVTVNHVSDKLERVANKLEVVSTKLDVLIRVVDRDGGSSEER